MGDNPVISTVIVNWNARDVLLACLKSLEASPPSVPWEAIVVDNGSKDGSVQAVRAEHPHVTVIANPENRGLPAANNQGLLAARGDFILISNPDVVYRPGAIDAMWATIRRHDQAAVVVPRLCYDDGVLQTSAGDLPRLREALLGRRFERRRKGATSGFWWDGWGHDEERQIGRGHEAVYLVRKQAVAEVGLQDERFPLDWEGVDWTARMRAAGWQVWFSPEAEVVHIGGVSIRQVQGRWIVSSHLGMYRYFAKRSPVGVRPALALVIAGRAAVKLVGARLRVSDYRKGHRG